MVDFTIDVPDASPIYAENLAFDAAISIPIETATDCLCHAQGYSDDGWAVIPLAPGGDEPDADHQWSKVEVIDAAEYFVDENNVAAILGRRSEGLTAVCLSDRAAAAAPYLLPPTDLRFGKTDPIDPSKARDRKSYKEVIPTTFLYLTNFAYQKIAPATIKYVDPVDNETLVELKVGGGDATVFVPLPPSVIGGKALQWDGWGPGKDATPETPVPLVVEAAKLAALVALISKHWKQDGAKVGNGGSHEFNGVKAALALGGFLHCAGVPHGDARRALNCLGELTGYKAAYWDNCVAGGGRHNAQMLGLMCALDVRIMFGDAIYNTLMAWLPFNPNEGRAGNITTELPPTDLFDPWERYQVPKFPLEVLPSTARLFVSRQAEVIGCDPSGLAMATLGAMSGALNHRFALKMMKHGSWWVNPRLWILLLGDPSTKKTPMMDAATKELDEQQKFARIKYRNDLKAYVEADGKPEAFSMPTPPRLTAYDSTPDALGALLGKQDRGILVKRDELAGWIGGMEKYSSGRGSMADRAFWLKAFDGGPFSYDRIGRGEIMVDNLSASVIGGIQPQRLAEIHGLTSDGLLQRFIPVMLKEATFAADVEVVDDERYAQLIRQLLKLEPHKLFLADDAIPAMESLRRRLHDIERASEGFADGFQGFVGKLPGIAGSLALILELAHSPNRTTYEMAAGMNVGAEVIADVTTLVVDYIVPNALEMYQTAEVNAGGSRLQRLASWILTSGKDRILASDLTSNIRDLRGLGLWDLNQRLSPLVAGGWLTPNEIGPTARSWTVNPAAYTVFAARAAGEAKRKSAITDMLRAMRGQK